MTWRKGDASWYHGFQIRDYLFRNASEVILLSALANFQTLALKDATRHLHHDFEEIEIQSFIIRPSTFNLQPSTFNLQPSSLCDPPCGYEWSKDHDAVTTREPMQNNSSVRQRLGQRDLKPETVPLLLAGGGTNIG